jgi:hypothetical protein
MREMRWRFSYFVAWNEGRGACVGFGHGIVPNSNNLKRHRIPTEFPEATPNSPNSAPNSVERTDAENASARIHVGVPDLRALSTSAWARGSM